MKYNEAIEYLFNSLPAYHRIGKAAYKADLNNTIALDEHFGNPHRNFRSVHIAGTNGKGSVSHLLASVFQEAGYRTGLYTSPHLKDFRERIRINGEMIPRREVSLFVNRHRELLNEIKPSFFEMTVALAFDYFSRKKAEVAIIETGLGGRLDSTNIIDPVLSVITNIGHDHMDLLGDTLTKVAVEKAGIIKNGVPVVIGESQSEISEVFITQAKRMNSDIHFADKLYFCSLGDLEPGEELRRFTVNSLTEGPVHSGKIPLCGDYQEKNLVTLFASINVLEKEFRISEDDLSNGISRVLTNTGLEGRWYTIGSRPLIVCDTGHNREGLSYVLNQLKKIPASGMHLVIGFVNDKDLGQVLPLFPVEAKYYFTRASVMRALDENILKAEASKFRLRGDSYSSVRAALNAAKANATGTDLIFVGGSTFVVADVL